MRLSEKKVDQALKNSIKDGSAYSAMDGMTSTYSTPFALALGANNAEIGILNSIPNLFTTFLQPFAGKYIEKRSRKSVSVKFGLMQKLIWLPIILIPLIFFQGRIWLFILFITLTQVALSFANTAWSSWMGNLVPEKIRGTYFGKRSTIQSIFGFSTTLLAGWILGLTNSLIGFSIIFSLAFIFGMVSYYYLTKIPEVSYKTKSHKGHKTGLNILEFIKDFKKYRNFYPFAIHMSLVNFAVNIASPFFTVYMLSVLKIGYEWYAIVIAAEILTRILMQMYWGKLSDKFGDRTILIICNILIVFYPFFFFFVTSPYQIILISIFSGIGWSGFDLATFNYLLDVTPPEKRPVYISKYKMLTGLALFSGALMGGFIAQYSSNLVFFWLSGLQIVFLISFILRGLSTVYGISKLEEVRVKASEVLPVRDVFLRAFTVYPARGITYELYYVHHCFECWKKDIEKKLKGLKIL
jgi:MFS family permease